MPPKGKKNKKQQDDWEADLGETIDPVANATEAGNDENAEAADEEDGAMAGGLMAAMRKNRDKKKKKGKFVQDFVEGEDPSADDASPAPEPVVEAPAEANMDDEFAMPDKKGKGKGGNNAKGGKPAKDDEDDEERAADGHIMTKKEKEKAKKEREKQRKKEQVGSN
jgi:translation initiation factor 5B